MGNSNQRLYQDSSVNEQNRAESAAILASQARGVVETKSSASGASKHNRTALIERYIQNPSAVSAEKVLGEIKKIKSKKSIKNLKKIVSAQDLYQTNHSRVVESNKQGSDLMFELEGHLTNLRKEKNLLLSNFDVNYSIKEKRLKGIDSEIEQLGVDLRAEQLVFDRHRQQENHTKTVSQLFEGSNEEDQFLLICHTLLKVLPSNMQMDEMIRLKNNQISQCENDISAYRTSQLSDHLGKAVIAIGAVALLPITIIVDFVYFMILSDSSSSNTGDESMGARFVAGEAAHLAEPQSQITSNKNSKNWLSDQEKKLNSLKSSKNKLKKQIKQIKSLRALCSEGVQTKNIKTFRGKAFRKKAIKGMTSRQKNLRNRADRIKKELKSAKNPHIKIAYKVTKRIVPSVFKKQEVRTDREQGLENRVNFSRENSHNSVEIVEDSVVGQQNQSNINQALDSMSGPGDASAMPSSRGLSNLASIQEEVSSVVSDVSGAETDSVSTELSEASTDLDLDSNDGSAASVASTSESSQAQGEAETKGSDAASTAETGSVDSVVSAGFVPQNSIAREGGISSIASSEESPGERDAVLESSADSVSGSDAGSNSDLDLNDGVVASVASTPAPVQEDSLSHVASETPVVAEQAATTAAVTAATQENSSVQVNAQTVAANASAPTPTVQTRSPAYTPVASRAQEKACKLFNQIRKQHGRIRSSAPLIAVRDLISAFNGDVARLAKAAYFVDDFHQENVGAKTVLHEVENFKQALVSNEFVLTAGGVNVTKAAKDLNAAINSAKRYHAKVLESQATVARKRRPQTFNFKNWNLEYCKKKFKEISATREGQKTELYRHLLYELRTKRQQVVNITDVFNPVISFDPRKACSSNSRSNQVARKRCRAQAREERKTDGPNDAGSLLRNFVYGRCDVDKAGITKITRHLKNCLKAESSVVKALDARLCVDALRKIHQGGYGKESVHSELKGALVRYLRNLGYRVDVGKSTLECYAPSTRNSASKKTGRASSSARAPAGQGRAKPGSASRLATTFRGVHAQSGGASAGAPVARQSLSCNRANANGASEVRDRARRRQKAPQAPNQTHVWRENPLLNLGQVGASSNRLGLKSSRLGL